MLSGCPALEFLFLHNLPKLENLEPIVSLSDLASLAIQWCSRLKDFRPVFRSTSLNSLRIFGCKGFDTKLHLKDLDEKSWLRIRVEHVSGGAYRREAGAT
jgi:hypothetical protein